MRLNHIDDKADDKRISIAVYKGYKIDKNIDSNIEVHYVDKDFYDMGSIWVETPYGNKVKAYSFERVACDLAENKSNIDIDYYHDILEKFTYSNDRNWKLEFSIATKMKIENELYDSLSYLHDIFNE